MGSRACLDEARKRISFTEHRAFGALETILGLVSTRLLHVFPLFPLPLSLRSLMDLFRPDGNRREVDGD